MTYEIARYRKSTLKTSGIKSFVLKIKNAFKSLFRRKSPKTLAEYYDHAERQKAKIEAQVQKAQALLAVQYAYLR